MLLNRLAVKSSPKFVRFASITIPKIDEFTIQNEPVKEYLQNSDERKQLESSIAKLMSQTTEIPIVINGKRSKGKDVKYQIAPFDKHQKVASFTYANSDLVKEAIGSSQKIRKEWEAVPINDKIKIFLRAADLVSGKYRYDLNAATMIGQGKTIIQAEIDAAAELADFFRFNAYFAKELHKYQPISEDPNVTTNTFRYRGLEGFIASISPFNFTAIGGNLPTAPTLMGNVVLWKPSDTALLSNWIIYQLLEEAGLPQGVINFIPADGPVFGNAISDSPHLAAINFTGSLATFRLLWKLIGNKIENYRQFPRLIGECGGKNFHFVHPSANVETVINSTIRSAFEYSGQKCSACSRIFVPQSLWPQIRDGLLSVRSQLKLGSPLEADTFLSAVIDENSFNRIAGYIQYAQSSAKVLGGGKVDKTRGWFVEPTIIETLNPNDKLLKEEIFGPVLTVYVYKDNEVQKTLQHVNDSCGYALTGAIFGQDQDFLKYASEELKHAAGNFYVNDKSTGSVVGQQPFGGGRLSGTNDKAGGPHYLLKWTSPQVVKETFVPITVWKYNYMEQ